jgi:hypothetical protein
MNVDEFKEILVQQELERVVQDYIFAGIPYVFRSWTEGFNNLRSHICDNLGISSRENIEVVGSARVGFSLDPENFGIAFSDKSDIDIVVVDDNLFDKVWKILLKWNYPRRFRLAGTDNIWARHRMEDLYWGWFRPDKIRYEGLSFPDTLKPLRDISALWFNVFKSISNIQGFEGLEVSGRLYRTWDHVMLYHVDGLRKILESVKNKEV